MKCICVMKRITALLLVMLLAALCAACSKSSDSSSGSEDKAEAPKEQTAESTKASGRLEGEGYDTPEEAVKAYLEALNRGDVPGMLSTFAMESYISRMDPDVRLEYTHGYNPSDMEDIPWVEDFPRTLALYARYGSIASAALEYYYLTSDGLELNRLETAEDRQRAMEKLAASPLNGLAGSVEFVEWMSPVVVSGGQLVAPFTRRGFANYSAYLNADDITEMAAHIRIDGKDALQMLRCVRYGNRWYNLDYNTQTVQGLTVSISDSSEKIYTNRFLFIPEDAGLLAAAEAMKTEYAEAAAEWDAVQQSPLAGSRWHLVSLSIPGVTVHDNPADAENDTGMGVWAEMHFMRIGGLITVTGSPAVQQAASMDDATAWISFPWTTAGIITEYTHAATGKTVSTFSAINKSDIGLDLKGLNVTMDESAITITLKDGTKAVFAPGGTQRADETAALFPEDDRYSGKLEGDGYDTPEDAVKAYVDALNRGDVRGILSTFAMESYIEHRNAMLYMQNVGGLSRSAVPDNLPAADPLVRSLIVYARYGNFARSLLNGYATYGAGQSMAIELKTEEEQRAYRQGYLQSPIYGMQGNVEFVRMIDLKLFGLLDDKLATTYTTAAESVAISGAEDYAEAVAQLRINGKDAYQTMTCVRYGNRWYNLRPYAPQIFTDYFAAKNTIMSLPVFPTPPVGVATLAEMMDHAYSEVSSDMVAWLNNLPDSDLAGTKWRMVSLNKEGVTIYDNADDAVKDTGSGAWAEMRLQGGGAGAGTLDVKEPTSPEQIHYYPGGSGLITVTVSPALQQALGMDDDTDRILFAWQTGEQNSLMIPSANKFRRDLIQLNPENMTMARDGEDLVLTLEDGTKAVFRRQ